MRTEVKCPQAVLHTPMPEGYLGWHDVARRRAAKRQSQRRCPGCDLFKVWTGGRDLPGWPKASGR